MATQLGMTPREDLVREVGARAEQWHAQDSEVMLAVGRMYLEGGLFAESQAALVSAGKSNPRDPRVFRYLGEVLLRRGDAVRAEKVLQRSIELGATDADTKLWLDRAVVYVALQKRVGPQAVAAEVARTLPGRPPPSAPLPVAMPAQAATSPWAEEAPTIRKGQPPPAARPQVPAARQVAGQARPRSVPPPLPPVMTPVAMPPAQRAPSFSDDDDTTLHRGPPGPQSLHAPAVPAYTPPPQPAHAPAPAAPQYEALPAAHHDAQASAATSPFVRAAYAPVPRGPLEEADEIVPPRPFDVANPTPELVLESLARVGIYEPGGGAPPAWEAAVPVRARGSWVLVVATILVLVVGGGGYAYARKVQMQRAETARRLGDEVEELLHSGEMAQLKASDDKLSRIFELDSRSRRASKLWLQNRVLGALILPGEARGIDAAVHRAKSIDVPEAEVAFGKVAAYLAEGDLAGAAATLPKYDKEAGKDAFYQLAAGAVFERAGDLRCIERYEAARAIDPKLVVADILLARAVLLELGPAKGRPVIEELKKKTGETPATRALESLAWAVDPDRPKELPKSAQLTDQDRQVLIAPLLPVPAVVDALQAITGGLVKKATSAIDSAISLSDSPAMATELGFLAIKSGDEKLARKAALRALQFSAVYVNARVLASRVALLGGRLDEAKKAIEEIDPKLSDVVVVRAVLAYETLDASELGSALEALGDAAQKYPEYRAIAAMPAAMMGFDAPTGEKLEEMAHPSLPWGELVAVDLALMEGDLSLAEKLTSNWEEVGDRPVFGLRVARLYRYQGKLDDAERLSAQVQERGSTTVPVIVERVFDLMAKNQAASARDLIAKYPSLLGPMAQWLRMYIDAKSGKALDARVKAAQLDPPPEQAPLLLRLVAARALAVAKDKRAKTYIAAMQKKLGKHPELAKAAEELK